MAIDTYMINEDWLDLKVNMTNR